MKIGIDALGRRLEQGLDPVYFVCGDEPFLVGEAADAIRAAARANGHTEREVHHASARGFDWPAFSASGAEMSLFSERRLIELRLPTARPGDAGARALTEWCADPPPDTILLLVAGKLESGSRKTKWVKSLEKTGVMVEVWPIQGTALKKWIVARMRGRGLQPHPEAVELLAQRIEGNLLAAAQEIDKLVLLQGEGPVDVDTVRASVSDSARYDVFQLVDAALAGDAARALRMLDGLKAEGEAPALVIWALARELRMLSGITGAIARGDSVDRALHTARVWDRRKPLLRDTVSRIRAPRAARLLKRAAYTERVVKGAEYGNAWDELLGLTLSFAGRPPARARG